MSSAVVMISSLMVNKLSNQIIVVNDKMTTSKKNTLGTYAYFVRLLLWVRLEKNVHNTG